MLVMKKMMIDIFPYLTSVKHKIVLKKDHMMTGRGRMSECREETLHQTLSGLLRNYFQVFLTHKPLMWGYCPLLDETVIDGSVSYRLSNHHSR